MGANDLKYFSIEFINDSICKIEQRQFCKSIGKEYQHVEFLARYKQVEFFVKAYKKITNSGKQVRFQGVKLNNIQCDSCNKYTLIPNYLTSGCFGDTTYNRLFEKIPDGVIYHFPNDTIIVEKNFIKAAGLKLEQLKYN